MTLIQQRSGKMGWCDYTWNPVSGCKRRCWYCYLQRIPLFNYRPRFRKSYLRDIFPRRASRILVSSSGDLFGSWIERSIIQKVIDVVSLHPEHAFLFLTKNPGRYSEFHFPHNAWLGTTIDYLDTLEDRLNNLKKARDTSPGCKIFISFEPLLEPMHLTRHHLQKVDWIIIGGLSGRFSSRLISTLIKNYKENKYKDEKEELYKGKWYFYKYKRRHRDYLSPESALALDLLKPKYKQASMHPPPKEWVDPILGLASKLNIPVWLSINYHDSIKQLP